MNLFFILMTLVAVIVFIALFYVDAGYGKFYNSKWGPAIDNKLGWVLMESPVFVLMALLYAFSDVRGQLVPTIFLILFELHYFNRSFIFPLRLRGKSKMPLSIILMGVLFNSLNAAMQGGWLFYHCAHIPRYGTAWLTTPWFILGTLVFFAGMAININSDAVIRNLRKPGDTKHYLPTKGLYRYVTSANYFGEFVEWIGYAILTLSPSGAIFALWTFANLGPRAHRIHKRYLEEFPEEMKAHPRKRLIPFVW